MIGGKHVSEENKQEEMNQNLFEDFTPVNYENWKIAAEKALKGAPFDSKMLTKTYENIVLKPIYRQEELGEGVFADSMPGNAPFVRSSKVGGYIEKPWLIAQECAQPCTKEVNKVLKNELTRGLQAINLHLDTLTQIGEDPSLTKSEQIADKGISISSLKDMEEIFDGIDLNLPVRIYAGMTSLPILSLVAAMLEKKSFDTKNFTGCIGADPIGELAQKATLSMSIEELYDQMAATVDWTCKNAPNLRTVIVDVSCYHNAGANAVQELAFAIATAVDYVKELMKRGIKFSDAAKHIQFSISLGANMFMELAKVRALRLLWGQVCSAYGEESATCAANIHARTSYFTKTIYDPYVNLLRATTESFAGAVGGVDSMYIAPLDEIVGRGDEFSRRISRNIQIMLQQECNLLQPIDPAGGSWYIESITKELAEKAWEIFGKIEEIGGMVVALEKELPQKAVSETYENRIKSLSKRKNVIVGTNSYANLGEKLIDPEIRDENSIKERLSAVSAYQKENHNENYDKALTELKNSANSADIFSAAIKAVQNGATLGDIVKNIKKQGIALPVIKALTMHRNAEIFEKLRHTTEAYVKKTGHNLKIFSANMGPIPQHKGRADFSRGFFEVGAFEVIGNNGFRTVEEAADAAIKANADVVIICSTDKTYPELVPPLAKLLKEKNSDLKIFLAGQAPEDLKKIYMEAGVDDFVFMGADCYKILSDLQKRKGMTV